MQTPRTEFAQAVKALTTEKGVDLTVILDVVKQAIIAAYKRDARERGEDTEIYDFDVEINPGNGEARIFSWPLEKPEERKDVTPPGFGRIAAQTAKQVIHQKVREAEKGAIMDEFSGRIGSLISGLILRFDGPNVRVEVDKKTETIMPAEERIPNERLNLNQRLTFLVKNIMETPRGKEIILSRADPVFVEKLFAREVPEIGSSNVLIKAIAREPGVRTKIAVASNQSGVDPVGSCVGQKGVRVQAVTNELGGERVDIIPWNDSVSELIIASLSPAENLSVSLDEENKTATVTAPEDQLSLVIGKEGQNVRLAAKLTGWRIEAKSAAETEDKEAPSTKDSENKKVSKKKASEKPESKKESAETVEVKETVKEEAKVEESKEESKEPKAEETQEPDKQ